MGHEKPETGFGAGYQTMSFSTPARRLRADPNGTVPTIRAADQEEAISDMAAVRSRLDVLVDDFIVEAAGTGPGHLSPDRTRRDTGRSRSLARLSSRDPGRRPGTRRGRLRTAVQMLPVICTPNEAPVPNVIGVGLPPDPSAAPVRSQKGQD